MQDEIRANRKAVIVGICLILVIYPVSSLRRRDKWHVNICNIKLFDSIAL